MNLASCQLITDIQPITGADSIERATVLGWFVVVKKDEFKIGDKVCYIQIDTVCPETEEFEFLRPKKFRVKTIKLRKQISQGLIVPLPNGRWNEGDDLTNVMKITKYSKPDNDTSSNYDIPKMPKKWYKRWIYIAKYRYIYKWFPKLHKPSKIGFPTNIVSKTDEERIQNCPKVLETYKGKKFISSYKLDGSSLTAIYNAGKNKNPRNKTKYRICSRNFEFVKGNNDWNNVFEQTGFGKYIDELVIHFNTKDVIVQGEMIGKFNGNHHNLDKPEIRLFNIQINGKRLLPEEFYKVCHLFNIPHCPKHQELVMNHTLESILKVSQMKDILNPNNELEGLVYRCVEDGKSFKVINDRYLLTED